MQECTFKTWPRTSVSKIAEARNITMLTIGSICAEAAVCSTVLPGADRHFLELPQLLDWIKPKPQTLTGKQKPGGAQAADLDLLLAFCTGL